MLPTCSADSYESMYLAHEERVMGIEPTYLAWKASVLPLNYTRILTASCLLAFCNAQNRNRTSDTRIFSPLLYQLSYLGLLETLTSQQLIFYIINNKLSSTFLKIFKKNFYPSYILHYKIKFTKGKSSTLFKKQKIFKFVCLLEAI